ncbi:MAG TPA: hypothetical protein VGR37_04580 [Longimicrobiaceae bacterium]|nr:hypothetical protein [Longimicrobiaceae bacterium]
MKKSWSGIGRGAFGLTVVGALGFGAQQAFAGQAAKRTPGCDKYECIDYCATEFRQHGACMPTGDGWYYCQCG